MTRRWKGFAVATTTTALALVVAASSISKASNAEMACPKGGYCDSFEAHALGATPGAPWIVESRGQPSIQVESDDAYLGEQSVKITARGRETAFISLIGAPLFPLADNMMYGRTMVKLEAAPKERVHWTMIEGKGASADGSHEIEYRYGGAKPISEDGVYVGSRLMANYETPTGAKTDCWHSAKNRTVMPTGRWTCLAWAFDGRANSMKLWIDGNLLDDLSVDGVGQGCMKADNAYRWRAPIFDRINIGWETYKEDEARTLWIDDVAVSGQPLACPKKPAKTTN